MNDYFIKILFVITFSNIFFLNNKLNCNPRTEKHERVIILTDSSGEKVKSAIIQIYHKLWGTKLVESISDTNGKALIDLKPGYYDIIITHTLYNQFNNRIHLDNSDSINIILDKCKEFYKIEGVFLFDHSERLNPFNFKDNYIRWKPNIYLESKHIILDYKLDSLGNFELNLPKGKFNIDFWWPYREKVSVTFNSEKHSDKIKVVFKYEKNYHFLYFFPHLNYNNFFEYLKYYPGIYEVK